LDGLVNHMCQTRPPNPWTYLARECQKIAVATDMHIQAEDAKEVKTKIVIEEKKQKRILVTGGAGYIGSHTCVELLNAGYHVTVVDNLSNSALESLKRVIAITDKKDDLVSQELDLCNLIALEELFQRSFKYHAVIHFAGLKAVGESVDIPLRYYNNNLQGTMNLLLMMEKYGCRNLVFSSSATVYGNPTRNPASIGEDYSLGPTNPYGQTKLMIETMLRDLARAGVKSGNRWRISLLRYFNPIGSHPSGMLGEDPNGTPNNLFPYVLQVAIGKREELSVYGKDYETKDGTGVRDYIHVVDLARGHLAALTEGLFGTGMAGDTEAYNLGSGVGVSVLEMVSAVSKASGREIKYRVVGRREGDVGTMVANPAKAKAELKWEAKLTLAQACEDGWRWQQNNPQGYRTVTTTPAPKSSPS